MSKKPSPKGNRAREQAAKLRAQQARAARRRTTAWVSAIVVVVLVGAGLISYVVYQNNRPAGPAATPAVADSTGGLVYGKKTAPVAIELYADYQCPVCKQYETATGPTIDKLVNNGTAKMSFHPLGFLNRSSSGTKYSSRSAAAAGCVSDQSTAALRKFTTLLYNHQPPEGASGLTNNQLISYGAQAGANKSKLSTCVKGGKYLQWSDKTTNLASKRGVTGTPTVYVNGKQVKTLSTQALTNAVNAATKSAKK